MIEKIKLIPKIFLFRNPAIYIMDFLSLKKGNIVYNLKNAKFKLRAGSSDRNVFNDVLLYNQYKLDKLKDCDSIIEVGAHIGFFSVSVAKKFPEARIYAFEPMMDNFNLLKDNLKINNIKNVRIFPYAVSNRSGKIAFYVSKNNARHSIYGEEGTRKKVRSINLREFMNKNKIKEVDLLKIDAEGAEYDIIYSLDLNRIRDIFMEVHQVEGKSPDKLERYLKTKGFKISKKWDIWYCQKSEDFLV